MTDDDKTAAWAAVLVMGGLIAVVIVLACLSLILDRPFGKYAEETRSQIYDSSRQYQQGTNRDVARYCEQMRTAPSAAARKAVAALIRTTADTFNGPLSADNQACLAEVKGEI